MEYPLEATRSPSGATLNPEGNRCDGYWLRTSKIISAPLLVVAGHKEKIQHITSHITRTDFFLSCIWVLDVIKLNSPKLPSILVEEDSPALLRGCAVARLRPEQAAPDVCSPFTCCIFYIRPQTRHLVNKKISENEKKDWRRASHCRIASCAANSDFQAAKRRKDHKRVCQKIVAAGVSRL